jgi:hypothetical protein
MHLEVEVCNKLVLFFFVSEERDKDEGVYQASW